MGDITRHVISGCWIAFLVYWFVAAIKVKSTSEKKSWSSSLLYRIPVTVGAVLFWAPNRSHSFNPVVTPNPDFVLAIATVLCVAGLFVAIWARRTIAGNWSSDVTYKRGHELVKSGPYRLVRHPIYTGILMMGLATALAMARLHAWFGLLLWCVGFWIKLKQEEALMLRHFPDEYPAYRKKTKALVPFVI